LKTTTGIIGSLLVLVFVLGCYTTPPSGVPDGGAGREGTAGGRAGATGGNAGLTGSGQGGNAGVSSIGGSGGSSEPGDAASTDAPDSAASGGSGGSAGIGGSMNVAGTAGTAGAGLGSACSKAGDCPSGFCVDGVCCETACAGQCESCAEANKKGICLAVTGAPRAGRTACAGAAPCAGTCDGANRSACTFPGSSQSCRAGSCANAVATVAAGCDGKGACPAIETVSCAPNTCAAAICAGGCSDTAPCTGTNFCSAGKCMPKKANGQTCMTAPECTSGYCVDGTCCNTACTGACMACNLTGSQGTCSPRKSMADDTCTGSMTCDATGACKKANGQVCAAATECASGACVDGHCCGSASCGACQACTGGGGTCVMVANAEDPDSCSGGSSCDATGACKKKTGQTCTAGTQCQTGNCADGYCCNTACNGACDACNGTTPGTCGPLSGSPRSGHASCNGSCQSGVCCAAGKTNCGGTCVDLTSDANHCGSCSAPACSGTCSASVCCPAGKTNCGGTCVDLTSDDKHCGACSGSGTDCTAFAGSERSERHCRASQCRLADGYLCKADSDCFSGKCDTFYSDSDKDGYPDQNDSERFCTFGQNDSVVRYIPSRVDGKWDCCDKLAAVHPGATQYYGFGPDAVDPSGCGAHTGDTNCDGRAEVDPSWSREVVIGCYQNGATCETVYQSLSPGDCGARFSGCSCSDACTRQCFVTLEPVPCL
jgi:hypothetical protein